MPPPPPSTRKSSLRPLLSQTFAKAERPTAFPPAEGPTSTKNQDIAVYQGLLSVFDEMTHSERFQFVELALLFKELTPADRRWLIDEGNRLRSRK